MKLCNKKKTKKKKISWEVVVATRLREGKMVGRLCNACKALSPPPGLSFLFKADDDVDVVRRWGFDVDFPEAPFVGRDYMLALIANFVVGPVCISPQIQ